MYATEAEIISQLQTDEGLLKRVPKTGAFREIVGSVVAVVEHVRKHPLLDLGSTALIGGAGVATAGFKALHH